MTEAQIRTATRLLNHYKERPFDAAAPELSSKRVAANRKNAQLSTGPKTDEGKAASSRNSFKHGLHSQKMVMEGEDPAELDALRGDLLAQHQPGNVTEELLVNEMADQYWRLRRCRRIEMKLLLVGFDIKAMNLTHRMMTAAERGFYKALATLDKLQQARGFVPQKPAVEVAAAAAAGAETSQTGFVPQNLDVTPTLDQTNPAENRHADTAAPQSPGSGQAILGS